MLGLSSFIHTKATSFTKAAALRMAAAALVLTTAVWGQSTEKVVSKSLVYGNGGLTFDQQGNLYGADEKLTRFGAIYRLHHFLNGAWGKVILFHFAGSDGASPKSNLVFDNAGNLYGATASGGDNNNGTVFQLTPTASGFWTEKVLYNFELGPDGFLPSNVIIDDQGNLFGTTFLGTNGTIFELVHNSDGTFTHKVLYRFTGGADGGNPTTGLVRDGAGNLYGATHVGGTNHAGTIFQLSPESDGTWTFHLVYTMCSRAHCTDGAPGEGFTSVTVDSHGTLFGITSHGGYPCQFYAEGCGVAFKLTHARTGTWSYQLLHTFCVLSGCPDGVLPGGALSLDAAGSLYDTTFWGGAAGEGVAFRLSHAPGKPWSEDVLYSFCSAPKCADGANPVGSLALDTAGNLFGTTQSLVFEVIP